MRSFLPSDEIAIGQALERLFLFQDKPFTPEKSALYLNELVNTGIPAKAILAGIANLMDEDLKQLKLATIIRSARQHTVMQVPEGCNFCHMTGFVDMVNKDGYSVVLACNCNRGLWYAKQQDMTRWNGKKTQFSDKYGVLKLAWFYEGMDIPAANIEEQNLALVASAVGNQSADEISAENIQWEE